MGVLQGFMAGINLGSWLEMYSLHISQWHREHSKGVSMDGKVSYDPDLITERDVKQIASWGYDHIRLPFSYEVVVDDDKPNEFSQGIAVLDNVLCWCKKYGLKLILDMHKVPGYEFMNVDSGKPSPFFEEESYQEFFYEIWRMLTRRYIQEGDNLAFELVNEVAIDDADLWNGIAEKAIRAIHEIDPDRIILFGGIYYNSVYYMKEMKIFEDDPYVVYNFHFYEPILFTHQMAWPPIAWAYRRNLDYPGPVPGFDEFLDKHPEFEKNSGRYRGLDYNRETMEKDFAPVFEFMAAHPKAEVYCGEFGVIRFAPIQSKRNWLSDIISIFNEHGIGHAVWDYTDGINAWFAFTDIDTREPLDMECIRISARRQ